MPVQLSSVFFLSNLYKPAVLSGFGGKQEYMAQPNSHTCTFIWVPQKTGISLHRIAAQAVLSEFDSKQEYDST